ncbi:MAG: uroporphyrinogen-III synthase [Bacteroidia bacterium]
MSNAESNYPKVKTILVSQPRPESEKSPYFELARKYNIKIDFRPFIKVEGVSAKDFRKDKINISDYTAILFNSRNAIDHFFRMCEEMRIEMPIDTRYFCISENIGVYVQKYIQMRKRKVFFGDGKMEDLLPYMLKHKQEKFLMPCSDVMSGGFIGEASKINIEIKQAVMYRTVSSDLSDLADIKYDMLAFFSPSGIKSLFENFPDFEQGNTRIAGFGAQTHAAMAERNLRVDVPAPTPEAPSMTMAIEAYIKKVNK